jgi:hypothetical protein
MARRWRHATERTISPRLARDLPSVGPCGLPPYYGSSLNCRVTLRWFDFHWVTANSRKHVR